MKMKDISRRYDFNDDFLINEKKKRSAENERILIFNKR